MANKTRFERWLDSLNPEQRAAFDASIELGDQEMMAEVQRRLPEELRFGGEFGLPSAIGYGKDADSRAQIRNYTTRGFGLPNILGGYSKSMRWAGLPDEDYDPNRRNVLEKSNVIKYMSGPPDRDATGSRGVSVFHPIGDNEAERDYASREGYTTKRGGMMNYPTAVVHELTHKFFDSPAFLDFLEETGRNSGRPLTSRREHDYIESVEPINEDVFASPTARKMDQNRYRDLLDDFRQWMTPEKEEKYDIRMPIRAVSPKEPSFLDRIIDLIRGR